MLTRKYGVGGGVKGWWWSKKGGGVEKGWWWRKTRVNASVGGVVGVKRVVVVVEKGWWWPKLPGVEKAAAVAKNAC